MTLDEMIKQEQANQAAQPQQTQQSQVTQQVTSHGSEDVKASQSAPVHVDEKSVVSSMHTIASSTDENVNKEEFSLKTKSGYTPTLIPEDFYTVKLVGIDKKEAKAFDSEEMVPNFVWKFEIVSDSTGQQLKEPATITKWCKAFSKGERSNNYQFYAALTGQTPEYGYNILDCIGKYARAYVTQKSYQDSRTGMKVTKSVIDKLLPLKK